MACLKNMILTKTVYCIGYLKSIGHIYLVTLVKTGQVLLIISYGKKRFSLLVPDRSDAYDVKRHYESRASNRRHSISGTRRNCVRCPHRRRRLPLQLLAEPLRHLVKDLLHPNCRQDGQRDLRWADARHDVRVSVDWTRG